MLPTQLPPSTNLVFYNSTSESKRCLFSPSSIASSSLYATSGSTHHFYGCSLLLLGWYGCLLEPETAFMLDPGDRYNALDIPPSKRTADRTPRSKSIAPTLLALPSCVFSLTLATSASRDHQAVYIAITQDYEKTSS
ncbi:hypothetical protein PG985_013870 [Apiospora marii]|uniref:uncharacterized protein n=1 Tax=Apiospora marii TaxID=335849 RepID=UPI00312D570B